jgi:hypothetical protein
MTSNRDRFNKVMAVAVNPGAYEPEAIAALRMARELVKQEPSLAHPPPPAPAPPPPPAPPDEVSLEIRITNIPPFWLHIMINSLSQEAFGLALKSKIVIDFKVTPCALNVRCDGPKPPCDAFQKHADWLLAYVNSQPAKA